MRISTLTGPVVALITFLAAGCGLAQLVQDGTSSSSTTAADASTDAATAVDSGVVGGGCGVESNSGQKLCTATSACPTVVVDTDAFPNCGFQVVNGAATLVCVCNGSICSMGAYSTCAQASALLSTQSQAAVCQQVDEGRCYSAPTSSSSTSSTSSTSSSSGSSCDKTCLQECGGGAGCASICGC